MLRRASLGALLLACIVIGAAPALAQSSELTVAGSVTGTLAPGNAAHFDVTATHPDGWRSLSELTITMDLHGAPLEAITFDLDQGTISAGGGSVLAGTGDETSGRFFEIRALDVSQTTGGDRARVTFSATVLEAVPEGTRFVFEVEDEDGGGVSVTRAATIPEDERGGIPWGTLAVAVLAALVAGGYLGAQAASHRRRRASIYETVARRIEEERRSRDRNARAGQR